MAKMLPYLGEIVLKLESDGFTFLLSKSNEMIDGCNDKVFDQCPFFFWNFLSGRWYGDVWQFA